ncbi:MULTISPECIES: hypothetical protein [Vagococcus]|uniref:Uncharacterized protein n=1 Tax=Vagococcus fluvialis bH819 TaxID=1255619 RepID=A0A1X6WPC8_9ENTE|nr:MULTISPECIES: hypothetical protein [Vagococcus]SLM86082.1 hypothetical protein FM121_08340 [Vagococcus fluvialis bH819]HCM90331.1 hypothetical protein [Vagococcus sp.]
MKKNVFKKLMVMGVMLGSFAFGMKVESANQGPYIKDGSIVQITKNNYEIWQNFNWKLKNNTNTVYNKTFEARGRYKHQNGSTYYSLFDNKGNWQGYLNANATKKTGKQGNYISDGSYVKVSKGNYEIWQNFGWQQRNNTNNLYNQTFQARGRYEHFNGSTYYSLYDGRGNWQGYLNAGATQKNNAQGNYISDGRYVEIAKNYELWQNFNWQKKGNGASHYNKSLQAKGRYEHFNGSTYYSLFEANGNWIGYINTTATRPYKSKKTQSTKIINKDTNGKMLASTNGYTYVTESTDGGVTTTSLNGDTHTVFTKTVVWEKDAPVNPTNPYMGQAMSNSGLDMSFNGGKGIGNSGMVWEDKRTASLWANEEIGFETGSYLVWEVKLKTGEIMWTAHLV